MPCARLTVIKALPGRKAEVEEGVDTIMEWLRTQKGYIDGWKLTSIDDLEEIVRFTIWKDLDSVNAAATKPKNLALRAKLMELTQEHATTGRVFDVHAYQPKAIRRRKPAS